MRLLLFVCSIALSFFGTAQAQIDALIKLGDKFEGEVVSNIDYDELHFDALLGTRATITVQGKNGFQPAVRIFDANTGAELFPGAFLSGTGSAKVKLNKFPLPWMGRFAVLITGHLGARGKYTVTTSAKVDESATTYSVTASLATGGTTQIPVAAIPGSKITLRVKPKKNSAAKASINSGAGPTGALNLLPYLEKKGSTVMIDAMPAQSLGIHSFVIGNTGGAGDLQVSVEVAVPKGKATKKEPFEPTTPGNMSGTLTIAPFLGIPEIAGPNNTVATAQYCGNVSPGSLVRIQGSMSALSDVDMFRIEVGQPLKLNLMLLHDAIGDDFDLGVFSVAQGQYLSPTFQTANEPEIGAVNLPASGAYLLVVWSFAGTGNYILTATGAITASAASDPATESALASSRVRPNAADPAALMEFDADFEIGEFIVNLRDPDANRRDFAMRNGLDVRVESPAGPFVVVAPSMPQGEADARRATVFAKERIRLLPEVEYAELNYRARIAALPNDPLLPFQWHYATINLPQAWDLTKGSQNVIVAVMDTGVVAHPDLVSRDSGMGFDFISNPQSAGDGNGVDPDPTDVGDLSGQNGTSSWHGSHVAGTVGAASNNGVGVSGVDWFCKLMHLRVLGRQGGTSFDMAEAVRYAARLPNVSGFIPAKRANVVNMSIQGQNGAQVMQDAVLAARAQGVTLVASAGNFATSQPYYPASYNGVISVSSIDPIGNLASYSNFGNLIDVAAPGGETQVDYTGDGYGDGVLSTVILEGQGSASYGYDFMQGTSMASPHVAGVAALLLSVNPNLTPDQVESLLESTAIDLGSAGPDIFYGAGVVDAFAAVKAAAQTSSPQLSPSTQLLDFGSVSTSLGFALANTGNGTLSWNASDQESSGGNWLTLSANAGNATPATPSQLTANVNRTGLAAGDYTATITVTSNGGQAQIQVKMSVTPPPPQPALSLSTNALDFGSTLSQLNFSISNAGTGSLTFGVTEAENPSINWLTLSTAGSTLTTGQSLVVQANANRAILSPGAYAATINVTSNGGNATIQVSLTVPPPATPNLSLSAQVLDFSTSISQLTVSVANTGGGSLSFTAADVELVGSGWLSVTPGNGVAPSTLTVTVSRNGLVPGHYSGRIDVNSNGGNKSVSIEMDVSTVQATPIPISPVFIVAVDPYTFKTEGSVQTGSSGGNWSMFNMPIGGYFLFAGPDLDKDGFLCGPGEPCGGYPTLVDPVLAIVFPGLFTNTVNFSVSADAALPATASSWSGVPAKGLSTSVASP